MTTAIQVEGLTKLYRRAAPGFRLRTLKSALLEGSLTKGLSDDEMIRALADVSFEVEKGKAFGVIGSNGSGKSTLLKTVAGMIKPSAGRVVVDGRVAALIELGAGFHPEISGRENIYINGVVLGLSRKEVDRRYDDIVEFSGLADFIEEPVKNYSSGMYVRLGFAVAIHTDPDVLLVDEVLAVGDEAFQHRCIRRIEEFLGLGKTLLLVSHTLDLIEEYADEALWLDGGRKRMLGAPRRVADAYRQGVAEEEGRLHREAKEQRLVDGKAERQDGVEGSERWGSRQAEIEAVRMLDAGGQERYHLESGDAITLEIDVRCREPLTDFVFGVGVSTPRGTEAWGTNTHLEGFTSEALEGATTVRLFCPALRLAPGEYVLDVAVHARDGYPYDYRRSILSFTVTSPHGGVGIYFPEHRWEFDPSVRWKKRP